MAPASRPGSERDWFLRRALAEDTGRGDITSRASVPPGLHGSSRIVAKERVLVCGLPVLRRLCRLADARLRLAPAVREGAWAPAGAVVARLSGPVRSILRVERVGLNLLGHLSGVAAQTASLVHRLANPKVKLLDTRKTFPLARALQKYAVRTGGGWNHRRGLYDMILLKENHLAAAGGVMPAIRSCRRRYGRHYILGVEVTTAAELRQALAAGADHVLIDNAPARRLAAWMRLPEVRAARPRVTFEASGGITARNLAAYGRTGVDFISLGCLTHSVKNTDYSLLLEKTYPRGRRDHRG